LLSIVETHTNKKYKEYTTRNFNRITVDRFIEQMSRRHNTGTSQNVSDRAANLVDNIVRALDIAVPKRQVRIPAVWAGKAWFSQEIRQAVLRRDVAYRRAIRGGTDLDLKWMNYRQQRNTVVGLIRTRKREYYECMIDRNRDNPRIMWKTLKQIIKGCPSESGSWDSIDFEGLEGAGDCSLVNRFNRFYVRSIDGIVQSINDARTRAVSGAGDDVVIGQTLDRFETITRQVLEEIVQRMPRKRGTEEGISTEVLVAAWNVVGDELLDVINASLSEGVCPATWKTSEVRPIPKVSRPGSAGQFRPINLLPTLEKVLELVVKEQLDEHLERNNIITEHQSGFRRDHSCETAIQSVVDEWKTLISDGLMVGVVFMDFRRAFETINRERLLTKLHRYGVGDKALEWFVSARI